MAQYVPDPSVVNYGNAVRSYPAVSPSNRGQNYQRPLQSPMPAAGTNLTLRDQIRISQHLDSVFIAGADAPLVLFPPQQPLQPIAQPPEMGVQGRAFDYQPGFNLWVTPRTQEPIGFGTMKALAGPGGYDVLRVLIERVKDKIVAGKWSIQPKDPAEKADDRCDQMMDFFEYPDRETSWQDWVRKLVEQTIVYDAPAIWLQGTRGGQLYAMHVMDGSLFTPKITPLGRIPAWNEGPAYQQVIKLGLPATDYIKPVPMGQAVPVDPSGYPFPELLYKPKNPRVDSVYGYGPVEQIITTVNIGLAREAYLQAYYTHGSRPDTVWTTPATWTTQQIVDFQNFWNAVLAGQIQNRSGGAMFVPEGTKPFDMKEKALTDETDQWLIRIMCFALGLNPMPFIKQMNKGQEKTHHDESAQEGLEPWQRWLSDLFETVMRLKFGFADLSFRWEEDEAIDPAEQATIDVQMVTAKIYHPDEIRAQRGDDPMDPEKREQMDMAAFNPAMNATVLSPDQQEAQNQHAIAMAAAKPAPVIAPGPNKPTPAEDKAQKDHEITLAKLGAPIVNFPAAAPITVTAPTVNISPPSIKVEPADVFIDVGPTSVRIDNASKGIGKTVTAKRMPDGSLQGTITDGTTRTVTKRGEKVEIE